MAAPLDIMIGLHYWTTPGDYDGGSGQHWDAIQPRLKDFVRGGLLTQPGRDGAKFQSTDALGVWIEALTKVRWPVQKWVMPRDDPPASAAGQAASQWWP